VLSMVLNVDGEYDMLCTGILTSHCCVIDLAVVMVIVANGHFEDPAEKEFWIYAE
jgi:hypothetical protein